MPKFLFIILIVSEFFFHYLIPLSKANDVFIDINSSAPSIFALEKFWNGRQYPGVDHYTEYSLINRRSELGALLNLNSDIDRNPGQSLIMEISAYRYPITVKNCFADQRVFVAVISASSYFEKRQMIRQTWFHNLDNTFYGFAFILGLTENTTIQHSIEEESLTFGDIIQMNFLDDYNNLTLKSIVLLHWLSISCPKISYILKCDDDVYVNVPNFSTFLASDVISSSKQLAIYGNFNNNRPMRSGKVE